MSARGPSAKVGAGANAVARLIPDLTPYPPSMYTVVYHPDVFLTADEWLELADYEKVESDALVSPGTLGFILRPDAKVVVPLHVASAKLHQGR